MTIYIVTGLTDPADQAVLGILQELPVDQADLADLTVSCSRRSTRKKF